jgi:cytochrome c peroxidase
MRRLACLLAAAALIAAAPPPPGPDGENPAPVAWQRPAPVALSAMAQLGQAIFLDASLSASGRLSCASCHSPAHAFGPPDPTGIMRGGPDLTRQGVRAVPSLMYLDHQPPFSIGPDSGEADDAPPPAPPPPGTPLARKLATDPAPAADNLVPQGGLFWDGRADTLQDQALGPLLNPLEMANPSPAAIAAKLRGAGYAPQFAALFGPAILTDPRRLASEAMFAVARYQIENPAFHPYSSKFDAWLRGEARFTEAEARGYLLFNDPARANCAGCHLDRAGADGTPPLFTDHQFEALGAPRNPALPASRYDLGVCGPDRADLRDQTRYCGMFATPTLRNVATRHAFFHNGVFHSLQQVMDFYAFRDVAPDKIYPVAADGSIEKYNDIPARYRANVDITDPPFDRKPGDPPAMTPQEETDIIAFLGTLTDGYEGRIASK